MEKMHWKILIITTIIIVSSVIIWSIVFWFYNKEKQEKWCLQYNGQWSEEFKECLGIDAATCEKIGGKFNECASACRNDPKAEICTMQCVQVCDVK